MSGSVAGTLSPVRIALLMLLLSLLLAGRGYNNIPTYEEQAKAKWADVLNQYQRRSDLIPNLVETVKGFAKQESSVLEAVTADYVGAVRVYDTELKTFPSWLWACAVYSGNKPMEEFTVADSVKTAPVAKF